MTYTSSPRTRAAASRAEGASPRARGPPIGYRDKLPTNSWYIFTPPRRYIFSPPLTGLSPKRKQKFKKTPHSQHNKAVASNLLDQNFSAEAPNEKWAADISYIWTAQGWLYLAVMLDLYSRRVIGWAVGARMTSDLPLRALNRAIGLRQPGAGVIHHSDRGSQYCSDAYQARLGELGFLASMSGKGNCYDNAVVETFFKTIKSELIWRTVFMSRSQAETAIAGYIDGFYNPVRRHSTLDFTSPVKFEAEAMQTV